MACHARKKCVSSKTLASAVNLNVVAESEGGQWSIFFWRTMLQMYQKYRTIAEDFWKLCAHYVQNIMRTLHTFLFFLHVMCA